MTKPGQIIGYKKNGSPIRLIAGGSEPTPPQLINQNPAPQPQLIPGSYPTSITTPQIMTAPPAQYFTAEQLEAARQQEKDKLYNQMQSMKTQLDAFKTDIDSYKADRDAAKAEADRLAAEAADTARREAESRMSMDEFVAAKKAEMDAQLEQQRIELLQQKQEMETAKALMEKERQFLSLSAYAQRRIAEEVATDSIAPELLDYITGNSEAEIEDSINKAKEKTASIVAGMIGQAPPRTVSGVSPTGFAPTGPLDTLTGTRQYTAEQIRAMNNDEYAQYRKQAGIDKAGNNKGLFN